MPWGSGSNAPARKKKDDGGDGFGGFVGNLLGDVKDAAVGIPGGIVAMAKDPIKTSKAIGAQTWQTWSPLFHGDFEEFGEQLYAHPLAPILDVATVLTLGGAGGARAASALGKAGKVGKSGVGRFEHKAGRIEFKHESGEKSLSFYKKTAKNPVQRARQEFLHEAANRLSPHLPSWTGLSKESRYQRMADRDIAGRRAAMMTHIATVLQAGEKFSGPNRLKYETDILSGSYHQMRKFAFEFDPFVRDARGRKVKNVDGSPKLKRIPKGYRAIKEHTGQAGFFDRKQHLDFGGEMERFGHRYTVGGKKGTFDLNQAARVKGGERVLIVPRHEMSRFGIEASRSHKFIRALYDKPTAVWKAVILGYRPAFFVNNAVGNHFMYLMANGGSGAIRSYVDAVRMTKGEARAAKELKDAAGIFGRDGQGKYRSTHWQNEFFSDQLTNTLADTTIGRIATKATQDKSKRRLKEGLFGVTHNYADVIVRRAQINKLMRENPKVQKQMKEKGLTFDQAAREVLRRDDGSLRREISQGVTDVVGDYHSLNKVERSIRQVVPFYTWDRHIARHMAKMVRDRPGFTDFTAKLGEVGQEENEDAIGSQIPDFLKGAIPLSVLGLNHDHPSRKGLLLTQGMNPYAAVPEVATAVAQAVKGGSTEKDALATQLNPFLASVIERATGRKLLTDTKREGDAFGVLLGGPYKDALVNLPQWKLAKTALTGPESAGKEDPLYEKDFEQYLTSFLGLPTRQMSPKRAASLAKSQKTKANAIY